MRAIRRRVWLGGSFLLDVGDGAATASQQTSAAVSKALARSLEASGGRGFVGESETNASSVRYVLGRLGNST